MTFSCSLCKKSYSIGLGLEEMSVSNWVNDLKLLELSTFLMNLRNGLRSDKTLMSMEQAQIPE